MSHHIYHTRGFILGNTPAGESNRFYKIFTEELGLLGAMAQGVREEKSKLRYSLQNFSRVTVDVVRGKEIWRITNAALESQLLNIKNDAAKLELFARIAFLVRRLVVGEGKNDNLFRDLERAADFLEHSVLPRALFPAFEALAAIHILARLGYLDHKGYESFFVIGLWTEDLLNAFEKIRPRAVADINAALRASHL